MCADIHAVSEQAMVEHWRRRWEELPPLHGPAAPFDRRLVAIYSELIGPPHGKRFLDVGTGRGGVSMAFAEAGAEVFLLDSSARALGYAGHRLHAFAPRLSLAKASALPFADNSFDIVISGGLLEHFDADTRICMLAEMARVARGHVLAMIPNGGDPLYLFAKWHLQQTGRWPWGEEHSLSTLIDEFAQANMDIVAEVSFDPHGSSGADENGPGPVRRAGSGDGDLAGHA